ncbi:MAG: hypothetical protein U5O39_12210 [Gammaproteobacteria bacterium]|nr:hypothetical protein [Gammaproteobacteria bacterium]
MRFRLIPVALVIFAGTAGAESGKQPWQLEMQEDDIRIYSRELPDSRFIEIKGTGGDRRAAEARHGIDGDGDGCTPWRAMCKSSEVLDIVSDTERLARHGPRPALAVLRSRHGGTDDDALRRRVRHHHC